MNLKNLEWLLIFSSFKIIVEVKKKCFNKEYLQNIRKYTNQLSDNLLTFRLNLILSRVSYGYISIHKKNVF